MSSEVIKNHGAFIWSVADLLRGDYKPYEYGKVILPLTVLRRLDCVLEPTKQAVLDARAKYGDRPDLLQRAAGQPFFNTSPMTLTKVLDDPPNVARHLGAYLRAFSPAAADVLEKFDLDVQIARLHRADLLYLVLSKFCEIDLHPDTVSNIEMGYLYEELIRRFSELSNETAGEHFTPREVIRLMVSLLFAEDEDALSKPGAIRTLFDPACGTGGMLSVAEDQLRSWNPQAKLVAFGQELNAETYAICRSDLMLKGQNAENIRLGNSFSEDRFEGETFDYLLANPPFGVEWKKVERTVRDEHEQKGFAGRFGAGLPRINDGSFLFLQHMIAKMKPVEQGGSRLAIVFNGSPLFTGAAGSGESEIRRWIIENDWLEAVVALPDQLFYNTGISTYFWIVTNRKRPERRGKVQLVDARELWQKMRKSLGEKRKELSPEHIAEITRLYAGFEEGERVKILPNESFGFMRITVERPLRLRWEVTDETIAAFKATKAYRKLTSEGWGEVEPAEAIDVLDRALEDTRGRSYDDLAALETDLAKSVLASWERLDWDVDWDVEYGAGCFAEQLEVKPALASQLLAALAVRDEAARVITNKKGEPEPDLELRDQENVVVPPARVGFEADVTARLATPEYRDAVERHMADEVLPYVPDAWVDHAKTKLGYEIPLTRHFYKYVPPRPLAEIDAEIKQLETEIQAFLAEVTE